ncbi:hypothetical protein F0562_014941 [Nyssa sinensis]|uniref:Uncharacterized protein n=1 Tax=Nyssa sinensis TaxID=561372 RepID=A0A5J4ZUI8_9ASTE|nr:hypothetical protein F0562_014941 [Nyssa sinensis]
MFDSAISTPPDLSLYSSLFISSVSFYPPALIFRSCYGKTIPTGDDGNTTATAVVSVAADRPPPTPARSSANNGTFNDQSVKNAPARSSATSPWPSPYPHGSASPLPVGVSPSPGRSTPRKFFKRPFPPPSPAKHIKASLARRFGHTKPREGPIPEDGAAEPDQSLDKNFGYNKNFGAKYELGKEVGRGHFGHTCYAKGRKGELRDHPVAVKIISKSKMTTAIAIEDVRREVKILKALSGHKHLVRFYDACEDANNVYIVMELCEGGELLDRILSRGGRYTEDDAKLIVVQILSVVAFCHLQGVVHRDLKPENFLFTSKNEDADMKLIDFGLSDFIRPDERLNDIVGSAYYVAPEVLHRSYSLEADIWSIGVITYILLCGSRPFWARTESGIFRAVLRADPNFDDLPWPSVSSEAKDFVKRLLNKDYRKRMTAAQALTHPWLRSENHLIPLDIFIYKLVKSYIHATPFKRAALKALSKALTEDELVYLRAQFLLLEPTKDGRVSFDNFKMALVRNATDAMKESRVPDILNGMAPLSYRKMDFEEFCAAAITTYQLEALEGWEQIASTAFAHFEQEGNRVISVEEVARELNVGPTAHSILKEWIRNSDGKLSLLGYTKFLHGGSSKTITVPTLSFHEAFYPLYGEQNVIAYGDGKSVCISMDERSSSGFHSQEPYLHGFFSASIKLPEDYTAGVVVTFYTANNQRFPGNHDEIDFEFLGHIGGKEWVVQTNFYGNGSTQTGREERYRLWFDPSDDFHQYSILWTDNTMIYLVDNFPIREVRKTHGMGGDWPSKPMTLYGTIWNGSNWATNGGKYKLDFKYGPFVAKYSDLVINGCPVDPNQLSLKSKCNDNPITPNQRSKMMGFRRKYMTYSYCFDRKRYAVPLPECVIDSKEADDQD